MSDGRPMLREVDIETGKKRLVNLPMSSDVDTPIQSYKYPGKNLGEIFEIDKDYVVWLMNESKASSRIKKACRRLLKGKPYVVPEEGTIVDETQLYDITL